MGRENFDHVRELAIQAASRAALQSAADTCWAQALCEEVLSLLATKKSAANALFDVLHSNNNDLTNHDLAHLADWANECKNSVPNPDWKRAYALIREGADLLLRRRVMSAVKAAESEVTGGS
jgi:hypothetical protein